jgi:hypothetical protein
VRPAQHAGGRPARALRGLPFKQFGGGGQEHQYAEEHVRAA